MVPTMRAASLLLGIVCLIPSPPARGDAPEENEPLSRQTGLLLGLSATIVPVLLGFAVTDGGSQASTGGRLLLDGGLAVGPSTGLYYARQPVAATVGALGRAVLLGAGSYAHSQDEGPDKTSQVGVALRSAAVLWTLLDVIRTPSEISKENRRREERDRELTLLPSVFARGGGGIIATGRF